MLCIHALCSNSSSSRQPSVNQRHIDQKQQTYSTRQQVLMMSDQQDSFAKPAEISGEPSRIMGTSTAEDTRKVPWLMEFNTFCSEASVVGLRYVVNQTASMFRRSVWLLLLLAGTAFTAYEVTDRTRYYFSYPTNINIQVEHVQEMRFPTVTICNENIITLSGATSLGKLSQPLIVNSVQHFVLKSEIIMGLNFDSIIKLILAFCLFSTQVLLK